MAKKAPSRGIDEDWFIENERPEEKYGNPGEYWTEQRIDGLLQAKGQARIQQRITLAALEHVNAQFLGTNEKQGSRVPPREMHLALDMGCGLGFSSDVLVHQGCIVIGIDIIPAMLERTMRRDISATNVQRGRYHPCMASMTRMPFRNGVVDVGVSISAAQWIDGEGELASFSGEVHRVLKHHGRIAIQFYPRSRDEMMRIGNALKHRGFEGGIAIDNPGNARKRKIFIVMRKAG